MTVQIDDRVLGIGRKWMNRVFGKWIIGKWMIVQIDNRVCQQSASGTFETFMIHHGWCFNSRSLVVPSNNGATVRPQIGALIL